MLQSTFIFVDLFIKILFNLELGKQQHSHSVGVAVL